MLPSAFKNWEEVPPDLMIELPDKVPVAVMEPEVTMEVGVIAPSESVMAGVEVELNTDPLIPLAAVTETVVTVPPTGVAQVLSPLKKVVEEGVPVADNFAIPTMELASVPLKVPPEIVPVIVRPDKLPTEVILFMAVELKVPLNVLASTVPVIEIP